MSIRIALVAAVLAAPFSAQASDTLKQLADHTGLSERRVQMILGNRSTFAEYPYTYQRSLEQFRAALGDANYRRLMDGESVVLEAPADKDAATRVAHGDAEVPAAVEREPVTGS